MSAAVDLIGLRLLGAKEFKRQQKARICPSCKRPYATQEDVDEAYRSVYFADGNLICWYGPRSAYSAGECRGKP